MSRPEALRRGRALRDELRSTKEVFTQQQFYEMLFDRCSDLASTALEGLVAGVAKDIDKEATQSKPALQQPLLPGFDMLGDYAMGEGRRIAKEAARIEHFEAALVLDDINFAAVREANQRKHNELEMLRPFWGPGMTKRQAVESYMASQSESA